MIVFNEILCEIGFQVADFGMRQLGVLQFAEGFGEIVEETEVEGLLGIYFFQIIFDENGALRALQVGGVQDDPEEAEHLLGVDFLHFILLVGQDLPC